MSKETGQTGGTTLVDLPNIGAVVAGKLEAAGIGTPDELRAAGSVEALRRIREETDEEGPCRSMLAALEGAIRGVRWHAIPKSERDELWREYQQRLAT